METGTAFNPGFLGGNFFWWVGQIADDSYWRDNMPSTKFVGTSGVPGWGARRKVRIIGLHPQSEDELSSDQLPWAQIMYPVTAGGGQAGSKQTANLRQGMFVFGFFLDGNDQQVPVIMGVLGNNTQTKLIKAKDAEGDSKEKPQKPFTPLSGVSGRAVPLEEKVPDYCLLTDSENGAIDEAIDTPHRQNVADSIMQEEMEKKICLVKPQNGNLINSALTAIQTILDNLAQRIDKHLSRLHSYVDAATERIRDIRKYMSNIACQIAKYMKIIFNQIMEFQLKKLNIGMSAVIAALPCSVRNLASQLKDKITGLIECLYNKMISCSMVQSLLDKIFNIEELEKENTGDKNRKKPVVPMCVSEDLTSDLIVENWDKIDNTNKSIFEAVDGFLGDVEGKLANVTNTLNQVGETVDDMTNITSKLKGMIGNIASALNFANLSFNIFGCEISPLPTASDLYQFAMGGIAASDSIPDFSKMADDINGRINAADDRLTDAYAPLDTALTNTLNTDIVGDFDKAVTEKMTSIGKDMPFAQPDANEPSLVNEE